MARGQITRLTQRTAEAAEEVFDTFNQAAADGCICEVEIGQLRAAISSAYAISLETDEAFGIGMSVMRGGVESGWAKRQGFRPAAVTG